MYLTNVPVIQVRGMTVPDGRGSRAETPTTKRPRIGGRDDEVTMTSGLQLGAPSNCVDWHEHIGELDRTRTTYTSKVPSPGGIE